VGTTKSKPPGPIIMIDESKIRISSQISFITLFSASTHLCCGFTSLSKLSKYAGEKPFS